MENPDRKERPWIDRRIIRLSKTAHRFLGWSGRLLYRSKRMKQPTTIFNANIFNSRAKKIWFGDLDVEKDREALLKLSRRLGTLYVLYETDGRFLEEIPTMGYIKSKAIVTVQDGDISYSKDFAERVEILKKRLIPKKS
jgi:hypothetical protein